MGTWDNFILENAQIFSSACFSWCSVNILAKQVHGNIGIRGSNAKKLNRDERVNIPAKEVCFFFEFEFELFRVQTVCFTQHFPLLSFVKYHIISSRRYTQVIAQYLEMDRGVQQWSS